MDHSRQGFVPELIQGSEGEVACVQYTPTLKRAKKTDIGISVEGQKKTYGTGTLLIGHQLLELPMEILFEILRHLDLAGVFNLARAAKDFRNILMHQSSTLVWKQAYANSKYLTQLPNCPNDLTELQFAHLAFEHVCHYCWRRKCYTIMWTTYTRCCSQCRDENFTTDPGKFETPHEGTLPFDRVGITTNGEFYYRNLYSLSALRRHAREYLDVPFHEKGRWLAEKKERQHSQMEFARSCRTWSRRQDAAQAILFKKSPGKY